MIPLSEAIRLGAMLGPQAFEKVYNRRTKGTCAFGAAMLAATHLKAGDLEYGYPEAVWPWMKQFDIPCPVCGESEKRFVSIISHHLNDTHRWTREAIADWVQTIEDQQQTMSEPEMIEVTTV
jgi:hypothetical protein